MFTHSICFEVNNFYPSSSSSIDNIIVNEQNTIKTWGSKLQHATALKEVTELLVLKKKENNGVKTILHALYLFGLYCAEFYFLSYPFIDLVYLGLLIFSYSPRN